jgi:D-glycero-alpha-D-manno-heptose-7-phosphate kinase
VIITRTPLRISFLGGGTDYPDHFLAHGGQTLSATIDKYSYITLNRLTALFDYWIRVSYSRLELVKTLDEIQHPSVRECLRYMKMDGGVEIHYVGDLPARSGLGSSSSFSVGLLHALHALQGEVVSRTRLAEEAVHVEQSMLQERVGSQDQYACAHGGILHLEFSKGGVRVDPIPLSHERRGQLESHLMLFYTGIQRHAHELLAEQIEKTRSGLLANDLGKLSALVYQGLELLGSAAPITAFGELLHDAWLLKRGLSSRVSSDKIDEYYERARAAGAIGGKLLGAGGGGFLLLLVPPDKQNAVIAALPEITQVPFRFESAGSTILFYNGSRG